MIKTWSGKQAFKQRLEAKYGETILNDFEDLFIRQFWNLADLGRKHGITRERARQMFWNLYGHGYQRIRAEKLAERNWRRNLCSMHLPPRVEPLLLKLEEEGLPIKKLPNSKFRINEHVVRFYNPSAYDYSGYGGKHFRIVLWNDDFNFGIVKGHERFYIIPKEEFLLEPASQRLVLYIRVSPYISKDRRGGPRPRDIEKYREAWHLLR